MAVLCYGSELCENAWLLEVPFTAVCTLASWFFCYRNNHKVQLPKIALKRPSIRSQGRVSGIATHPCSSFPVVIPASLGTPCDMCCLLMVRWRALGRGGCTQCWNGWLEGVEFKSTDPSGIDNSGGASDA